MEQELLNTYAILSRQAARCAVYSLRAKKDNRLGLVQLFNSLSLSHEAQATRILMQVRGFCNNSDENLKTISTDELPALETHFSTLKKHASQKKEKALTSAFDQSIRVEKKNRMLCKQVSNSPKEPLFVCNFCGFIANESAPATCPICTAPDHRFIKVTQ